MFRSILTVAVLALGLTACAGTLTQSQWQADVANAKGAFDALAPVINADLVAFKATPQQIAKAQADEAAVDAELVGMEASPVPVSVQSVAALAQTFINDLPPGSVSPAHLLEADALLATVEGLSAL